MTLIIILPLKKKKHPANGTYLLPSTFRDIRVRRLIIVHKYLISKLTRAWRQRQYVLVRAICFTTGGGSICLGITC